MSSGDSVDAGDLSLDDLLDWSFDDLFDRSRIGWSRCHLDSSCDLSYNFNRDYVGCWCWVVVGHNYERLGTCRWCVDDDRLRSRCTLNFDDYRLWCRRWGFDDDDLGGCWSPWDFDDDGVERCGRGFDDDYLRRCSCCFDLDDYRVWCCCRGFDDDYLRGCWSRWDFDDYRVGCRCRGFDDDYLRRCSCCLLYTSPSPRDGLLSRMPSSA